MNICTIPGIGSKLPEPADHGVRINAVSPSIAPHEFLKNTMPAELLEELASREAFGRAAQVWDMANVMMFLASDYSSYMTGEIVPVSSQRGYRNQRFGKSSCQSFIPILPASERELQVRLAYQLTGRAAASPFPLYWARR